jgi:hypothetical protein
MNAKAPHARDAQVLAHGGKATIEGRYFKRQLYKLAM